MDSLGQVMRTFVCCLRFSVVRVTLTLLRSPFEDTYFQLLSSNFGRMVDGSAVDFIEWGPGEPNGFNGITLEDQVMLIDYFCE